MVYLGLQNCRESTTGDQCQLCAKGYYGEPNQPGGCRPCACPSTDRNFADSCQLLRNGSQSCSCSVGYRGDRCQKCDYGYFGNPSQGVSCQACLCNVNGSVSDECDELNGQCNCKPGITGRDCSYCAPRHVISPTGCTCKTSKQQIRVPSLTSMLIFSLRGWLYRSSVQRSGQYGPFYRPFRFY